MGEPTKVGSLFSFMDVHRFAKGKAAFAPVWTDRTRSLQWQGPCPATARYVGEPSGCQGSPNVPPFSQVLGLRCGCVVMFPSCA